MMFLPEEYAKLTHGTAPKARALSLLATSGYFVPQFVVLSEDFFSLSAEVLNDAICKVRAAVPAAHYAVRFAAFNEDTHTHSHAGRYETKLAVSGDTLTEAFDVVVGGSRPKLAHGESFAVIVQEYIEAEVSGVVFTRHPNSATSLRIEYAKGAGAVVGGASIEAIDIGPEYPLKNLPTYIKDLVSIAKEIEQFFDHPQDIEWCYKGGILQILQSRPITTFLNAQWEAMSIIDSVTLKLNRYHYTTDVIGESYKHPRPLNRSLLGEFYKSGGPVDRAYKRLGIKYQATGHLTDFGATVFIDKEKEMKMLLPAYYLGTHGEYRLSYMPLKTLITTAKNKVLLEQRLSVEGVSKIVHELFTLLQTPLSTEASPAQSVQKLLQDFETIFLINYLAQKNSINEDQEAYSKIYAEARRLFEVGLLNPEDQILIGNSLSLDDVSKFTTHFEGWVVKEQTSLSDLLRELGRWHSVRLANHVRFSLANAREDALPISPQLLYYATYEEVISEHYDEVVLKARQLNYEQQQTLQFPPQIRSCIEIKSRSYAVISEGEARGVLLPINGLQDAFGSKILYVDTLSPELVEQFAFVAGIVVKQGGLLSHAAIVAREWGLPVILWPEDLSQHLGKDVTLSKNGIEL